MTRRTWILTIWPEQIPEFTDYIPFYGINYAIDDLADYLFDEKVRYLCLSLEYGSEKEHEHYHAYIELKSPQRMSHFVAKLGKKNHYEACKGNQEENIDYVCHTGSHKDKPGKLLSDIYERGTKAKTGVHDNGTYSTAVAMLFEGASIPEICKALGGGILPQIGNLCRLKAELSQGDSREKEAQFYQTNNKHLTNYIQFLEDRYYLTTDKQFQTTVN